MWTRREGKRWTVGFSWQTPRARKCNAGGPVVSLSLSQGDQQHKDPTPLSAGPFYPLVRHSPLSCVYPLSAEWTQRRKVSSSTLAIEVGSAFSLQTSPFHSSQPQGALFSFLKLFLTLFADQDLSGQSYGFSSSHVWMWELDHKEGWAPKNWCFLTVVLEKTLGSPLDCKEIQLVHP